MKNTVFTTYTDKVQLSQDDFFGKIAKIHPSINNNIITVNGKNLTTGCIQEIIYDEENGKFKFYDYSEMLLLEIDNDNHIEFNYNEYDKILYISITEKDKNTKYPYYIYNVSKENDIDIVKIKLRIDENKEINIFEFKNTNILSYLFKIEDKLNQLKEQFFRTYLSYSDDVYLYMNDSVYEILSLSVNGIICNEINVYTQEKVQIFIDYMELSKTLYFLFTNSDIVIVNDQLFKAGINIGSTDTLKPLLITGYDFDKSLMVKFANMLEIAYGSDDIEILKNNLSVISLLYNKINEECGDIILERDLINSTIFYFYRGELYTYNHKDSNIIIDELTTIININTVDVLLDE